jgi:hypothetical protein
MIMSRPTYVLAAIAIGGAGYLCFHFVRPAWMVPLMLWASAPFLIVALLTMRKLINPFVGFFLSAAGLLWGFAAYFDSLFVRVSSLNANVLLFVPLYQLATLALVLILRLGWRYFRGPSGKNDKRSANLNAPDINQPQRTSRKGRFTVLRTSRRSREGVGSWFYSIL